MAENLYIWRQTAAMGNPKHHHQFYHDVEAKFFQLSAYTIALFVAAVFVLLNENRYIGFTLLLLCDVFNLVFIIEYAYTLITRRREYYNVLKGYYGMMILRLVLMFLFWVISIWLTADVGVLL